MRALVVADGSLSVESNRPSPEPGPGEALVRLVRAAVGGTDVRVARGMFGFTGVPGHLFSGIVESVNGQDSLALVGKRVVGSVTCHCGKCDMCTAGLSSHCRERAIMGMIGRDGCLAEHFTLPYKNLAAIDDSIDDDHAVFAELVGAAVQAARQLTIEGHPYITVLGDGALGLVMVQVMAHLNASVRLIGRHAERLSICEKWGIKHRHVDDIGRRSDQDVVVDCTGSPTGFELATQLVRPWGTIVLKTLTPRSAKPASCIDLNPLVLSEIQVIGSHRGPLAKALSMISRREVDVVSLISRRMSLADGESIFHAAAHEDVIRVVVDP